MSINIRLDAPHIEEKDGNLIIYANVTSVGNENNQTNNVVRTSRHLTSKTRVDVIKISDPQEVSLDDVDLEENITVMHQIEMISRGPTPIYKMMGELLVPMELPNVGNVVELTDIPVIKIVGRTNPVELIENGTVDTIGKIDHELPEYRVTQFICPCLRYITQH